MGYWILKAITPALYTIFFSIRFAHIVMYLYSYQENPILHVKYTEVNLLFQGHNVSQLQNR